MRGVPAGRARHKLPPDAAKAEVTNVDPHPKFKYHGGGVVKSPQVYSIFLGDWKSTTNKARAKRLNRFLIDLVGSTYMNILSQYGCGKAGNFKKSVFIANTDNDLSEVDIHTILQNAIDGKVIPEPVNHNNVYMIFLDNKPG